MNIVVFGANGRLGRHIVSQLIHHGHFVRALVHENNTLSSHPRLEVHRGDVHEPAQVLQALSGMDRVVSSLGSKGARVADVASAGTANIVRGMKTLNLRRIVSVTGSAAYDEADGVDVHPYLRVRRESMLAGAPHLLADGEQHLRILRQSTLSWTVVRAPIMVEGALSKHILSMTPGTPWTTLPYPTVASAMTELAETEDWLESAPFVRSSDP